MAARSHQVSKYVTHLLLVIWVMLLALSAGYGQRPAPSSSPIIPSQSSDQDKNDRLGDFGSPEAEMRKKLEIKAEKKDYEENLARAREVSDLATQVLETYQTAKTVTLEASKKLDRLEKLTKKIRNEAGGSESDVEAKDLPSRLEDAAKRIVDLAEELKKLVEKTPRHVISAAVINQANKLIGVVQYMRTLGR
jgi:hypothetical protein